MNGTRRVIYLTLAVSLIALTVGKSQALFNLKTGVESWAIQDEIDLSGHSHHSGQTFGFDLFMYDNRFLFSPGFHYHRISIFNEEDGFQYRFGDGNHFHYFSIPLTVGYKIFDSNFFNISGIAGEETFFFYDLDENDLGLTSDEFYGVIPALTAVVHTEFWSRLTVDVKYRYSLLEIIKDRPESKMSGFSLEAGIKF